MYDSGNCIIIPGHPTSNTNCTDIPDNLKVKYLPNCAKGTVNGQSYFMEMKANGISVLYFPLYSYHDITINGRIGANGQGNDDFGEFTNNGWKGYYKQTWGQSDAFGNDPGINHLWLTNAPTTSHAYDTSKTYDFDYLSGVYGMKVIYLMWGTVSPTRSSPSKVEELFKAISNIETGTIYPPGQLVSALLTIKVIIESYCCLNNGIRSI